ncbi:alpha/beta hydrolase [Pseudomonas sp. Marseille-Q5117]|uniref:alpha/beta hydrolase n=1 Tax=Pseudomonas sp. Marseille-Q5117 TaxID=2972777 RepID=UPI0021C865C4|nr:alpha/beta hydrolase-fold protein [Pseudomonas sp. Marseille-Q5117]
MDNFEKRIRLDFPGIPDKDVLEYLKDGGYYPPAPELTRTPGIPQGFIKKYVSTDSKKYGAKNHDFWIYVPAQYNECECTRLMVFLDGSSYLSNDDAKYSLSAPTALDNLIHDKKIPPIIGVFINPSHSGVGLPIYGGEGNRSVEYDSVNSDYANFLIKEILPTVENEYNISKDPRHRAIMGASSGGAGAFGVAWHRPDSFGIVISSIGSFVNIRGADSYISLVRHSKKKSIRVYLQDGKSDLDTVFGNWRLANEQLASSLEYKEYTYRFEQGEGGHNYNHIASLIGDVLRWAWSDPSQ